MAKCFRMVLFSLIAVAFMTGSALAQGANPYVSAPEIAACEVAAANYFYESEGPTANTKKMGTICYTLGQDYNVNDRIIWTLSNDSGVTTTFQDDGEYFMVAVYDDANPNTWSCKVYIDIQGLGSRGKAWNAQQIPTGKPGGIPQSFIEFRTAGGTGARYVKRGGFMQSAYQAGVQWCLAQQCDVTSVDLKPTFADTDNIAILTTALGLPSGCCNRFYITERSDQWLTSGYIEFDKRTDGLPKISWVMGSKEQFVGTKSDVNDLFDQQIYCPDRRYFANGEPCDTYTKILCATTSECGQQRCSWDGAPGYQITNVYTIDDSDVITMTVQATQAATFEGCLSGTVAGYSQCSKNGDKMVCWLNGAQIKSKCPSWPTTDCSVQFQVCTCGDCQLSPKYFKNVKDEIHITGNNTNMIWDISPEPQYQYAGIWGINGTQFIVPYLTSITGYATNCFLNSKAVSSTYAWADIFAMQSCDSPLVTDGCFAKLLGVTNIPIGPIAPNGQKRFDFQPTTLVPYNRDGANANEVPDGAMTFNFVANGVSATDRFAALVTVCNLDQYAGWKQGNSTNLGFDTYTNDWPGVQNLGATTPNSSLSCIQAQPGGAKRTLPILTPLGMVWKN